MVNEYFLCYFTDEYLDYFYATPYAAVQGNNEKIFRKVTPNNCARKCLTEREFVCRSFDYQVIMFNCRPYWNSYFI